LQQVINVHVGSDFWTIAVAVGALVLAVAALWSARAAVNIDRRNAERQRWRDERHERAAARLVWGELLAAQEAAQRAIEEANWPLWETMSRASWDQHGDGIAAALAEDDFWQVADTYNFVSRCSFIRAPDESGASCISRPGGRAKSPNGKKLHAVASNGVVLTPAGGTRVPGLCEGATRPPGAG
jgi:hypothetical protein